MGRLIEEVNKKIYRAIPVEQIKFRKELLNYMETLWNKAPEVRSGPDVYMQYASILAKWIDPHCENLKPWEKNIIDIFNGVEEKTEEKTEEMKVDIEDFDYMHHTLEHY
jgi:hypothetical protein